MSEAIKDTALGGDAGRQVLPRLYEQIRSWVLDPSHEPWKAACHFGWGVLVQRGMAAWMESCLGSSVTSGQDAVAAAPSVPVPALRLGEAELAMTLASIVLGHIQGAAV